MNEQERIDSIRRFLANKLTDTSYQHDDEVYVSFITDNKRGMVFLYNTNIRACIGSIKGTVINCKPTSNYVSTYRAIAERIGYKVRFTDTLRCPNGEARTWLRYDDIVLAPTGLVIG